MTQGRKGRSPEVLDDPDASYGIASEKTGKGTFDDGWTPGDPDPHTVDVHNASDPDRPGIALPDAPDLIG